MLPQRGSVRARSIGRRAAARSSSERKLRTPGGLRSAPPPGEVRVGELDEPLSAEARLVAGMDDRHGELPQALYRREVGADVAVRKLVEERPVVDRVAREEDAGRLLPGPHAAG